MKTQRRHRHRDGRGRLVDMSVPLAEDADEVDGRRDGTVGRLSV